MVIPAKTICEEESFQAKPSNKNICCIFVISNIDGWLHHKKIFSFNTKESLVARYEYMKSEDSVNNCFNYFGSVGRLLK